MVRALVKNRSTENWAWLALQLILVTALAIFLAASQAAAEEVEYKTTWAPNDARYHLQWNFQSIGMESAWDLNQGGRSDVTVAVVDTGLSMVPDFAGTNIDWANAYDFVSRDSNPADGDGHGTHVAGTIAQATDNAYGTAGMAFNTTLLPIKALDDSGRGSDLWVAQAIDHAVASGADVINLSLGGGYSPLLETACQNAYDNGVLVVAAAGNDGLGALSYPAAFSSTLAVGALSSLDSLAYYSNHGTEMVVAPGGDYRYDADGDGFSDLVWQQGIDGYLWGMQGTSMAAPHVTAMAALILSEALDLGYDTSGILPGRGAERVDWLLNVILSTVQDLGAAGQDSVFGWGKVQVDKALASIQNLDLSPPTASETPEPATLLTLASVLPAVAWWQRRRRRPAKRLSN